MKEKEGLEKGFALTDVKRQSLLAECTKHQQDCETILPDLELSRRSGALRPKYLQSKSFLGSVQG